MKKVLSFLMIFCILFGIFALNASADNIAVNKIEDFEGYTQNDDVKVHRIYSTENDGESEYGTHFEFKQIDEEHKKSVVLKNVEGGINFHPNRDNSTDGVYHYSFELYPYTTDAKRIFKIRGSSGTTKNYSVLCFNEKGKIECFEYTNGVNTDSSMATSKYDLGTYNSEKWYKVDLYLDTINNEYDVAVSCNGKEIAGKNNIILSNWGTGAKRFKIVQQATSTTPYGQDLLAIDNAFYELYTGKRPGADSISYEKANSKSYLEDAVVLKIGDTTSYVNGVIKKIDSNNANIKAFTQNDRTLVPVRFLAEAFGCKVNYINETQEVVIEGNQTVKMQINSNVMTIGEKQETIDQPAILVDDARTFAPLRAVCELALNKTVLYKDGIIIVRNDNLIENEQKLWEEIESAFKNRVINLNTTFFESPKTTRAFAWEATSAFKNMQIKYGTDKNNLSIKKDADYTEKSIKYSETGEETLENRLFYKVALDNLTPGTTYYYLICDEEYDYFSEVYSFTTEEADSIEFSMIAVADPQGETKEHYNYYEKTLMAAFDEYQDAKFIVNAGDMVEYGPYNDYWNLFFEASYKATTLPLMTCLGNHETREDGVFYYNLHFNNPQSGKGLSSVYTYQGSSKTTSYLYENIDNTVYSFDYGNAHFAVLNTGSDWNPEWMLDLMKMQRDWLKADLNNSQQKWKIVILHRGIYTVEERDNGPKDVFLDIIDECGVDLVLQGHDHSYMRTYQMKNDKVIDNTLNEVQKGNGTVYTVIGSAAHKRYTPEESYYYTAISEAIPKETPSYAAITFKNDKIIFEQKLSNGETIDRFEILE